MVMSDSRMIDSKLLKQKILEQSKRAGVGHIGSALSIADIIAALFSGPIRADDPEDPDRDRFVLSKGHAALALYCALHLQGRLTEEELNTYCGDNSKLGVHPEHALAGIDFSTGSLGHGLSVGTGAALGARMQKSGRRVFVLVSDAECNEGSLWEAAMFAAHHGLANLVVIVDANAQQAFGYTKEVLDLGPLPARWQAHGWDAHDVDGHDVPDMVKTVEGLNTETSAPHVLVARTVFGHGVSYMENAIKWHYWPMSDGDYKKALTDIQERT